ncbi:DUF58 domain-containing protein [Niveibacterium umoris]
MLRGRTPERLPVVLGQRRIYVLPTGPGMSFGALLLAMLVASLNYNLALGFALTFTLAGIGHLSMVRAHRNLLGLTLEAARIEPTFAGETRRAVLIFGERANRMRPALSIQSIDGPAEAFSIPPRTSSNSTIDLPAKPRGWHGIGRLRLETRYPLGFVVAWSYFEPDLGGFVYPAPEAGPPPLPSSGSNGEGRPAPGPDGSVFDSLRPYREGDAPRRIAWRQLARGGPLATKHFESEAGGERWLRWSDCPTSLTTEARLARLCAWALMADRSGETWGVELPGHRIEPGRGATHLRETLEALALFQHPR